MVNIGAEVTEVLVEGASVVKLFVASTLKDLVVAAVDAAAAPAASKVSPPVEDAVVSNVLSIFIVGTFARSVGTFAGSVDTFAPSAGEAYNQHTLEGGEVVW